MYLLRMAVCRGKRVTQSGLDGQDSQCDSIDWTDPRVIFGTKHWIAATGKTVELPSIRSAAPTQSAGPA